MRDASHYKREFSSWLTEPIRGSAPGEQWSTPRGRLLRTAVLLVDDQAVVRAGLRTILETDEAIEVVGEANDGREAVTLTQALDPDVVMMDIRMPVLDGIKATERLMSTGTRAQSAHADHIRARRICLRRAGTAVRGGARGRRR